MPSKVNELLFVNEYLANGRNANRAYQKVHPKASYQSCRRAGAEVLAKIDVQRDIAERVKAEGGITKELVESTLLQALAWAKQKEDAAVVASIGMDMAKLAGFLVDRHADVSETPTLAPKDIESELTRRGLVAVPNN